MDARLGRGFEAECCAVMGSKFRYPEGEMEESEPGATGS